MYMLSVIVLFKKIIKTLTNVHLSLRTCLQMRQKMHTQSIRAHFSYAIPVLCRELSLILSEREKERERERLEGSR